MRATFESCFASEDSDSCGEVLRYLLESRLRPTKPIELAIQGIKAGMNPSNFVVALTLQEALWADCKPCHWVLEAHSLASLCNMMLESDNSE